MLVSCWLAPPWFANTSERNWSSIISQSPKIDPPPQKKREKIGFWVDLLPNQKDMFLTSTQLGDHLLAEKFWDCKMVTNALRSNKTSCEAELWARPPSLGVDTGVKALIGQRVVKAFGKQSIGHSSNNLLFAAFFRLWGNVQENAFNSFYWIVIFGHPKISCLKSIWGK